MAATTDVTGRVTITGDASGLDKSAKAAKGALTGLEKEIKKTGEAHEKATKSAANHGMSIDAMKAQVFGSIEILKKAVGVIDMITEAEIAAGGGADVFTQSWIKLKATLNDPAFFQNVQKQILPLLASINPFVDATGRIATATRDGNMLGDSRRGIGFAGASRTARSLASNVEAANLRDQANLTTALLGSLMEGERVRQEHLKTERGITKELAEQKVIVDTIAESHRENELARLQAARERSIAQREEPFGALQDQFGEARVSFETLQIQRLEAAKQAAHDANMARIEEEKKAEEERIATIERNVSFGEMAANVAVSGLLDITDARRDAVRMAKLEGKTNREAAQAGKIAAAMALEAQLKSLRNMAAMHAIEYTAKGIASQASTYGIPNPQSIGYFTAAGIFAGIAVGSGLGAMAAGNRADSLQSGMQSDNGFGGGGGFGGAANGRGGGAANTGPSPIDSTVPGSPTPQPRSGTAPMGSTTIIHVDKVYGTVDKDFARKIDFALGELGHERRRNS